MLLVRTNHTAKTPRCHHIQGLLLCGGGTPHSDMHTNGPMDRLTFEGDTGQRHSYERTAGQTNFGGGTPDGDIHANGRTDTHAH